MGGGPRLASTATCPLRATRARAASLRAHTPPAHHGQGEHEKVHVPAASNLVLLGTGCQDMPNRRAERAAARGERARPKSQRLLKGLLSSRHDAHVEHPRDHLRARRAVARSGEACGDQMQQPQQRAAHPRAARRHRLRSGGTSTTHRPPRPRRRSTTRAPCLRRSPGQVAATRVHR